MRQHWFINSLEIDEIPDGALLRKFRAIGHIPADETMVPEEHEQWEIEIQGFVSSDGKLLIMSEKCEPPKQDVKK